MSQKGRGSEPQKVAAAMSVLLIGMVLYTLVFTGTSSRGWFLELMFIWPALSVYWIREAWRWAVRRGFIILKTEEAAS